MTARRPAGWFDDVALNRKMLAKPSVLTYPASMTATTSSRPSINNMGSIRPLGLRARAILAVLACVLAVGGTAALAAPAAAAASCSSLGRYDSYISGSCRGYPSFTIVWKCYWSPAINRKTFYTSASIPGASFNFYACGSGVEWVAAQ